MHDVGIFCVCITTRSAAQVARIEVAAGEEMCVATQDTVSYLYNGLQSSVVWLRLPGR